MATSVEQRVQRPYNYAIIDEVDSILIDESRTPLIMSAPTKDNSELYKVADKFVRTLSKEDYEIDLKELRNMVSLGKKVPGVNINAKEAIKIIDAKK